MISRTLPFLAGLLALAGCIRNSGLPTYDVVPDFTLTDQTGKPFSGKLLDGRVWIADFIFTTCQGPCPRMTAQFRRLQKQLGNDADLRFVSFTIDPARDTPEALAEYGKRFNADPARWVFLTGTQHELNKLSDGPFHAGRIDGSLTHSTRFCLVDRRGRIRGYYDSSDADKMRDFVGDVRALLKESA